MNEPAAEDPAKAAEAVPAEAAAQAAKEILPAVVMAEAAEAAPKAEETVPAVPAEEEKAAEPAAEMLASPAVQEAAEPEAVLFTEKESVSVMAAAPAAEVRMLAAAPAAAAAPVAQAAEPVQNPAAAPAPLTAPGIDIIGGGTTRDDGSDASGKQPEEPSGQDTPAEPSGQDTPAPAEPETVPAPGREDGRAVVDTGDRTQRMLYLASMICAGVILVFAQYLLLLTRRRDARIRYACEREAFRESMRMDFRR